MIEIKTPDQIALMREAGKVVARTLRAVRHHATAGIRLRELDELAATIISESGAKPAFLDYQPSWAASPFPGVVCVSVNDAVVHGIPDGTRLAEGDVVSIDCGAFVDGWCGDAAITFPVGVPSAVDGALIDATDSALRRGIEAARVGAKLGDIANAIARPARAAGYGLLAHHGGHGIGRAMHEDPHVPNDGRPGRGFRLRPGIVIAIEPQLILGGGDSYRTDRDGWTLRTSDGTRAAHSEHTVAITDDGPQILTAP